MNSDWVKSAAARRVFVHWADSRPAWLWSADGATLLWHNRAARFFNARMKKHGLKVGPEPTPIKGQTARLIRLGSFGRSSLSRIQFIAGEKPISTTCTATPLEVPNGAAVLIVGVDPVDSAILGLPETLGGNGTQQALLPAGTEYLIVAPDGHIVGGSDYGLAHYAETIENNGLPEGDSAELEIGEGLVTLTRLTASPEGHQLLLVEGEHPATAIADVRAEEGIGSLEPRFAVTPDEPLLPMDLPAAAVTSEEEVPPAEAPILHKPSLSSLFDRLAGHDGLYGELSAADEHFVPPPEHIDPTPTFSDAPAEVAEESVNGPVAAEAPPVVTAEAPPAEAAPPSEALVDDTRPSDPPVAPEPDVIAAVIEFEHDLAQDKPAMFRVTGRGFTPIADAPDAAPPADSEAVEQTSRRNFSELSRLLADRVGAGGKILPEDEPVVIDPPIEPPRHTTAVNEGALINIAAETFILNRLPLGIMVFRDQQVLFANRALTDLVGYETIDNLRAAGLTAIFPSEDAGEAGPVTQLVRRDGTRLSVTARLQSITWQGRPALMLSAAAAEPVASHEGAVRDFAETLADIREDGLVLADRSGKITLLSPFARAALRSGDEEMTGEALTSLVRDEDRVRLRLFLEEPARFAETVRPGVKLRSTTPGTTILLFAEGQAGIVSGYFGFVTAEPQPRPTARPDQDGDVDPPMLARVSRGVRRPLNTIIGFADLIRSAAFGAIENHRYLEYARDIKTAGQEIALLVDELDDYTRLRAGNYATRPADLDLVALLESCVLRVRGQANAARVLVRSAISERLPHVRVDRATLGQAVLNLLASAIDQTPAGGSVILSAQVEEDGSVVINVRDSGEPGADPGERFVVFREGVGKDGEALAPVRSSVGLALTRSLVAVNACALSVTPAGAIGTLFSLTIPSDLVGGAASA